MRLVYDDQEFASVVHSDCPDFLLRRQSSDGQFGVEVTELYETESDARATFHETYVDDLLAGAQVMHRDDVDVLAINRFVLTDSEGNVKASGFPAILRPLPTVERRSEAISRVLELKSAKTEGYRDGLSHLNLIIFDRMNGGHGASVEVATADLFAPGVRRALRETSFREVFLVSRIGSQYKYRPLQMLLLIEAFQLFVGAVNVFDIGGSALELRNLVPLFVHEMQDAGLDVRLGADLRSSECAVYRGAGIRHSGDAVEVVDFANRGVDRARTFPDLLWNGEQIAAFTAHYAAFRKAHTYVSEFALPARTDPDQAVG